MPSADLILYGGDFNTEPNTVPYRLLKNIVPLTDAWTEYTGKLNGGETYSTDRNSFTKTGRQMITRCVRKTLRAHPHALSFRLRHVSE